MTGTDSRDSTIDGETPGSGVEDGAGLQQHEPTVDPEMLRRRARTVPAWAFAIAVVVALALAAVSIVALSQQDSGDRDIRLAASRFAERFLTFEHGSLDDWKTDVLALSTPAFAEDVGDVESSLRALIGESELNATTQVTDVFVGDVDRDSVDVVLIYDRELRSPDGVRTERNRYMQVLLNRVDGTWLVDEVIDIATAQSASAGAGG